MSVINFNYIKSYLRFTDILSYLIISFYMISFPAGSFGYILMSMCLILSLITANIKILAIYFMLIGPIILGAVFQSFNIPSTGSLFSIIVSIFLLFFSKKVGINNYISIKNSLLWIIWVIIILSIFYIEGPKTTYSDNKITYFIINLLIYFLSISIIISDDSIDFWKLGQLSIISSMLFCAILFYTTPSVMPLSFFDISGIRSFTSDSGLVEEVPTNTASYMAAIGISLLSGSLISIKPKKILIFSSMLVIIFGFLILNLIGQRLYIVSPLLGIIILLFCKPKDTTIIKFAISFSLIGLSYLIFKGITSDIEFISSIFATDINLDERLNRSINWGSAIELILERPFLGFGLGGYYIDGYSMPGEGTYAHNLILELLSETGIVGTTLILSPVLFKFFFSPYRLYELARCKNSASLIPFFVVLFSQSMISFDLRQSASMFALAAILWARMDKINQLNVRYALHHD